MKKNGIIDQNCIKLLLVKMNNSVVCKAIQNMRKHKNITFVTTERRRNYLVSEPNYHITKFFKEKMLTIEIKETQILMNKHVYLDRDEKKSDTYE